MRNREVAAALEELADYLTVQGQVHEPRAYRRAARTIAELDEPIETVHAQQRLTDLPGVGQAIADKVAALLDTGEVEQLEQLRQGFPVNVPELLRIQGLGAKSLKRLYEELAIHSVDELERAARTGRIRELKGFGAKREQQLLEGIRFYRESKERHLLATSLPVAQGFTDHLRQTTAVTRIEVAGSVRRLSPTVGDLNLLVSAQDPEAVMEALWGMEEPLEVLEQDEDRCLVELADGLKASLRFVPEEAFAGALVYETGSRAHNLALHRRARSRGMTFTEQGLLRDGRPVGETEEGVYEALELALIPPELREARGEVRLAEVDGLPPLIEHGDLRGDLQMHTTWSDGATSILEMARKGDELGYEYMLITDHGPSLSIVDPPSEEELPDQWAEIDEVNEEVDVQVLKGIEANIGKRGLDVSEETCEQLDLVVASLHDQVGDATDRVVEALETHRVDIFAHPTNRLIGRRPGNELDVDRIAQACQDNQVAIEINAQPRRLDLQWTDVHQLRDRVPFVISTDAHSPAELDRIDLGVTQARKGWLTRDHVLNTQPLDQLLKAVGR